MHITLFTLTLQPLLLISEMFILNGTLQIIMAISKPWVIIRTATGIAGITQEMM
jgi:hypothetical protein